MRLPYAPTSPPSSAPASVSDIYAAVAARRGERGLQALDLTLLHSPPFAAGWNSFLGAVRTQTTLDAGVRELAICRVAVLNGAEYEWRHHAPLLVQEGMAAAALRIVLERPALTQEKAATGSAGEEGLSEAQWAVLDYTDQMTRQVKVDEAVFGRVKQHFSEQHLVELTGTVAAYNCVSRFLVALDVGESVGKTLVMPEGLEKEGGKGSAS